MRLFPLATAIFLASAASAQTVVFQEDFEGGFANWSMTGLWNAQSDGESCTGPAVPFPSGTSCAWYGSASSCDFFPGDWGDHYLTYLLPITLPATAGSIELRYRTWSSTEQDGVWDLKEPEISLDGTNWVQVGSTFNSIFWGTEHYPLTAWAGLTVHLRFRFWAGDSWGNDGLGWLVDDVQVLEIPEPAVAQCLGDGTYKPCPCSNQGGPGRGCASSFNAQGARLVASGGPYVYTDTLVLAADGLSNAAATIFQGTDYQIWPGESFGGDGLTCMRGPFRRIATVPATAGAITYPTPGAPSISVRGGVPFAGATRYYAARYRNALSFCTQNTFNVTNSLAVVWRP